MRSIQQNKVFRHIILLFFLATVFLTSCDNSAEEFEKKGPGKQESRRVIVDVNIISFDDKVMFEALFYYDIPGMVDGKEVGNLNREVTKVNKAKLGDIELKEAKDSKDRVIYRAEIPNEKKEYELTFAPNENLESLHKITVEPISIKQEKLKLEISKIHELELSRTVTTGELPAIVEITKNDKFLPARAEYLKGKLFFDESSLKPFPLGENTIIVRFESIPNQRDENKSIRYLNYVINRKIEIVQ